jgi:long-subunit acyl-CoA synthetase (AMP-forming)
MRAFSLLPPLTLRNAPAGVHSGHCVRAACCVAARATTQTLTQRCRYTSLGARGVEHALAESRAAAVVTDAAGARVMAATSAAGAAQRIVLLPPRGGDAAAADADAAAAAAALPAGAPLHTWRDMASAAARADASERRSPAAADTALIMFTSGSTGTPKARSPQPPRRLRAC